MKSVAIFGAGIVGNATAELLQLETHFYDPPKGLDQVTFTEDLAIIAVPTDQMKDGRGNLSLGHDYQHLYAALDLLKAKDFKGIICIRSTCDALTIRSLRDTDYPNIVFWPEFLREATWQEDSRNPDMVVIGGEGGEDNGRDELLQHLFDIDYGPRAQFILTDAVSAAVGKLSINSFLAVKVAMMNVISDLAKDQDASFEDIVLMMKADGRCGNSHMEVPGPDGKYGFGGKCFPKDLSAMARETEVDFLEEVLKYNDEKRNVKVDS